MGNLILQMQTSIDGFVARTGGGLDWLVWNFGDDWTWDSELKKKFNDIFKGINGIVLSGHMGGEGYIDHWTTIAQNHKGDQQFAFAQKIADVPKYIFSNSLTRVAGKNTSVFNGDFHNQLKDLKDKHDNNLICFGGASFGAALLGSGLVDEIQLFVNPSILGSGISIFNDLSDLNAELISSKAYTCGISLLKYRLS
jgi:dihydrofolate reductase